MYLAMLLRCHCAAALGRHRPFIDHDLESWILVMDQTFFQQVMSPKTTAAYPSPSSREPVSTLLTIAASNGQEGLVRLSDRRANIEESICNGETALHLAAWLGHLSIISKFAKRGASFAARRNRSRR
ncbi:hypothetical protein K525DRAFT_246963 [Schizophyllum commune Loenen D]|nr:hypothetical protein K525DRAFT_246963 [Schizophyllum commune Loenen D]